MSRLVTAVFDGAGFVAAALLSLLFAIAAVSKLKDLSVSRTTFSQMRLPLPGALAVVVPLSELAIAAALVLYPREGSIAAALALIFFTIVILRTLSAGTSVACGCFGSSSTDPVSAVTVLRNVLLLVMSIGASFGTGPAAVRLNDVILVSTATLLGVVLIEIARLKVKIGAVWDNTLAGEVRR